MGMRVAPQRGQLPCALGILQRVVVDALATRQSERGLSPRFGKPLRASTHSHALHRRRPRREMEAARQRGQRCARAPARRARWPCAAASSSCSDASSAPPSRSPTAACARRGSCDRPHVDQDRRVNETTSRLGTALGGVCCNSSGASGLQRTRRRWELRCSSRCCCC